MSLSRPTRQDGPRRCESAISGASVTSGGWIDSPSCWALHTSSTRVARVRSLRSVGRSDARIAAAPTSRMRPTTSRLSHVSDTRHTLRANPGAGSTGSRRRESNSRGKCFALSAVEAGGGTRTHGPRFTKPLLYQLSYSGSRLDGSPSYCSTCRPRWCWSTLRLTRWSALSIVFVSHPSCSAICS
jgi:hypothetical protein